MNSATRTRVPTPAEFEALLATFISTTLLGGSTAVGRDTRLFEDGYINSLRILDLIAMIEKTLGARVPDRAVRLANFRTITAIVRAFHPDAASEPAVSADRLFERKRDRSRFASAVEELQRRGDLTLTGAGLVSLTGEALEILEAVDHTVMRWAHTLGAPEHRYPSLIDRSVLERAGQTANVILSAGARDSGQAKDPHRPGAEARESALVPAVCYHAYPALAAKTLGSAPTLLSARGRCHRREDGNYAPLERLLEFTMREIIVMGTREQVEDTRQSLVRQVIAFVERLELDGAIESATDPFFAADDDARRLMQQAGALKFELRLTVEPTGRTVAVASFNHHHDFFGTRFDIRLPNGNPAHSGCVAFGLERWVLALLAQHGLDLARWPTGARSWIADSRHRAHGVGA